MYAEIAPKLFENGWRSLLPLGVYSDGRLARDRKACFIKGWSKRSIEPLTAEGLAACVARYPRAGVGCAFGEIHGLVAIDIDVEEKEQNDTVRAVARRILPRSDFIRIGRAPKVLLLYRGNVRSSKHHGIGIEIFGSSGQTVLFGIHPKTQQPYRWPGLSPLDHSPGDLPTVTGEQIDAFLAECGAIAVPNGSPRVGQASKQVDLFATLANERRLDGEQAAARQLMNAREGRRHPVMLSVTGYLVSKGYSSDEIADFVGDFFPEQLRRDEWGDVRGRAAAMAEEAIAKYGDKDWSL
jgi:hypothetical protein